MHGGACGLATTSASGLGFGLRDLGLSLRLGFRKLVAVAKPTTNLNLEGLINQKHGF